MAGKGIRHQAPAQIFASLSKDADELRDALEAGRKSSNAALSEFTDAADQQRQHQYRCQLETVAGNYSRALQSLAKSFGLPENSGHEAIGSHLSKLAKTDPVGQRFGLLHWLRLGSAWLSADGGASGFAQAADKTGFLESPWGFERGKEQTEHEDPVR